MEPEKDPKLTRSAKPESDSGQGETIFTGKNITELVEYIRKSFAVDSQEPNSSLPASIIHQGIITSTLRIESNPVHQRDGNAIDSHSLRCDQIKQSGVDGTIADTRKCQLVPDIERGKKFFEISVQAKNNIFGHPQTSLDFLIHNCERLPDDIHKYHKVPKGQTPKDKFLANDNPRYSCYERYYCMEDYREYGMKRSIDSAYAAYKVIMDYYEHTNFLEMHVYCDPDDPWRLRIFFIRLDPVKLLTNIIEEDKPSNAVLISSCPSHPERKRMKMAEKKLTVSVQETDHNFSEYTIKQVLASIRHFAGFYDNVDVYLQNTRDTDCIFVHLFLYKNVS